MPRSKEAEIGGKKIVVYERKIKELEALAVELSGALDNFLKADNGDKAVGSIKVILYEKIPVLFPGIDKDDIAEAYPSELEDLVGAFIEIHFFALKRMLPGLMALVQAGLKGKM